MEIDTKGNLVGQRDRQGGEGGGFTSNKKFVWKTREERGGGTLNWDLGIKE